MKHAYMLYTGYGKNKTLFRFYYKAKPKTTCVTYKHEKLWNLLVCGDK